MERYEIMAKDKFKNELDLLIIKIGLGEKNKAITVPLKRAKIVVLSHIMGILSVYSNSFVMKFPTDYYMNSICRIKGYKLDMLPDYQKACELLGLSKKNYTDIGWICDKFDCHKNISLLSDLLITYNRRFN